MYKLGDIFEGTVNLDDRVIAHYICHVIPRPDDVVPPHDESWVWTEFYSVNSTGQYCSVGYWDSNDEAVCDWLSTPERWMLAVMKGYYDVRQTS